jgi:ribosomal protein S18 acetylase RimI-like enzyme
MMTPMTKPPPGLKSCPLPQLKSKLRRFLTAHADFPKNEVAKATRDLDHWTTWCDSTGEVAAAMRFQPNDWYLCTLKNAAVAPAHRGKGYGSKLYQATTSRALASKGPYGPRCLVLAADVTATNTPSIKALKRAGFERVNTFCWKKKELPADVLHYVRTKPKNGRC